MATSAYTRARGQRASQMSSQSQSGGRCPAVHRCTLLGQHFHYAHLHCFLMNRLAGIKKRGREEREILLLAATKQVCSRLYHRGCFKVIHSSWNINHTPTVKRITSIWEKQAGRQPTYCLQQVRVFTHSCGVEICLPNFSFYHKFIHTHEENIWSIFTHS